MKKNISIIMPAFNEAENIEKAVRDSFGALRKLGIKEEVVVTDDGSRDDTLKILKSLKVEFPGLKIIEHSQNQGYGAALKNAVQAVIGDCIVSIDSDGQFDVSEISLLIEEYEKGFDVIAGYRRQKKDSLFKVVADKWLNFAVRVIFSVGFRDTNCAFRLYGPGILDKIKIESKGYQAPTEILLKLNVLGARIKEVEITHVTREKGRSALNPFIAGYKMFLFLLYLRLKICFYRRKIVTRL